MTNKTEQRDHIPRETFFEQNITCNNLNRKEKMKRNKRKIIVYVILYLSLFLQSSFSQANESVLIKNIFNEALSSHIAYENLRYLCKNMKGRITGSPQAAAAVEFTRQKMQNMKLDSVYLQEVMVPNWQMKC